MARTFTETLRSGFAALKLAVLGSAWDDPESAPSLTSGAGVPSSTEADGSLYLDTTNGDLYVRKSSAWTKAVAGGGTITEDATGTGAVALRFGATDTEGLELRVYEATVTPAAVETNLIQIPANSVILSVQGNCEVALVAGGTSVTWSIGIGADPDKYGTAAGGDTLAQNSKLNRIPNWTFLTMAEQLVLTAAATGGTADGDTAFSAGSVRVRVVYYTLNSLDDAAA